jgi:hypothetical protein
VYVDSTHPVWYSLIIQGPYSLRTGVFRLGVVTGKIKTRIDRLYKNLGCGVRNHNVVACSIALLEDISAEGGGKEGTREYSDSVPAQD